MHEFIEFSELNIFYPEEPKEHTEKVEHISLTADEAKAKGWRFRRKSGRRVRITGSKGRAKHLIIPAEIDGCIVNELGERAFIQSGIVSVCIPDTIKKMGKSCFKWCFELEKAIFADGLTVIPDEAFSSCRSLRTVHLPLTVREIGEEAFSFCHSLEYIDIPTSCVNVRRCAFLYTGLKSIGMEKYYACFRTFDGTALSMTPIFYDHELIMCHQFYNNDLYVLMAGRNLTDKYIRFPEDTQVYLGKNAIANGSCRLDLTGCYGISIGSYSFSKDIDSVGFNSVFIDFPENNLPVTLPARIESNFFELRGYHYHRKDNLTEQVDRECVQLVKHSVDDIGIEEIRFRKVFVNDNEPVEVFSPKCESLHKVSWEHNGKTVTKYTTPKALLREKYYLNGQLLKAFTIRRDSETDESIFYDRSVIDRLFYGVKDSKDCVPPTRHDKVLIAVDMLRSTQLPGEEPNELYRRFLLKNKFHADKIIDELEDKYSDYKDFLIEFYKGNTAQRPPEGFVRNLLASFPSYYTFFP